MEFNDIISKIYQILNDGFNAPVDAKRPSKVRRNTRHAAMNPLFNQGVDPGSTSGFLGSKDTKMSHPVFTLPRKARKHLRARPNK